MRHKTLLVAVSTLSLFAALLLALLPPRAGATDSGVTPTAPGVNSPLVATTYITVNFSADLPDYNLTDGHCDARSSVPFDQCSLRAAIQNANQTAGPVVIVIPPNTYNLGFTGSGEDAAATGDLDITKDVTILGAGAASTIIQWSPAVIETSRDRVFHIVAGSVTISGVTIQGGYSPLDPVAAGILVNVGATLNLNDSIVTGNLADGILNNGVLFVTGSIVSSNAGIGIDNYGQFMITNSTLRDNSEYGLENALGSGVLANSIVSRNFLGGVDNYSTLNISNTTVTGNGNASCVGCIGGINNEATLSVTNSTLNGNAASPSGAGLYQNGIATLINTTVSGNTAAGDGGGIRLASGTLTLNNVTIADNTADSDQIGGGDGGGISISGGTLNIKNSIIAGNHDNSPSTKHPDCSGSIISQGYNLIQDTTGCTINGATTGNLLSLDPKLGPLQNNGGATFTHAIVRGSPAIDAGNPAVPGSGGDACPMTDQRGVSRLMDGDNNGVPRCDIGAYEFLALHVNSPNDAVDAGIGDGVCASGIGECTLRAAIQESNFWPGEDLIFVPLGTYELNKLGPDEVNGASGDLNVNDSVVIVGTGAGSTIIQGTTGWNDRILRVTGAISVELSGVTVRAGNAGGFDGGGILIDAAAGLTLKDSLVTSNTGSYGGGIFSDNATLILSNTLVSGNNSAGGGGLYLQAGSALLLNSAVMSNTANWGAGIGGLDVTSLMVRNSVIAGNVASVSDGGGVAIFNTLSDAASATFDNSTIDANSAARSGGGIFGRAAMTLTNSTIRNNHAALDGGGLDINNTTRISRLGNSTVSGNSAQNGGGIFDSSAGVLNLTNSTVSGNQARQDGGGVFISSTVSLNNATISNNNADSDADGIGNGGGVFVLAGTTNFKNTLIAGNVDNSPATKHPDCYGGLASQGYNLVGARDAAACTFTPLNDQVGTVASPFDPKLGPLQNNGGPTPTHALLAGSPAIDAGNPAGCTDANGSPLTTDQRGYLRPVDGNNDGTTRCDIGAYEFAPLKVYLPLLLR